MKYVFIVNSIINIGGGQQYYRNKIIDLKSRGYQVYLFHACKGKIYIDDLKEYANYIIKEIKYRPYIFTPKHINSVIDKIVAIIGNDTDTIIDSSGIANAEWGEMVAKRINCKHVCFLIDEQFQISSDESDFFYFKLIRKELAGTSIDSLPLLFSGYKKISDDQKYTFGACCRNTVEDYQSDIAKNIPLADYNLGCFGRLEKGYVINVLKQFRDYADLHPQYSFNIIIIGGTDNRRMYRTINNMFKNSNNTSIMITGYLFPVPLNLLRQLDFCCASAGCARALVHSGIPTLYVNIFSGEPIGLFNYDIPVADYRYAKSTIKMDKYINRLLFEKYYVGKKEINELSQDTDFSREIATSIDEQLAFCLSEPTKQYYDVFSIKANTKKQRLYSILVKVLGFSLFEYVHLNILHNAKIFFDSKTN